MLVLKITHKGLIQLMREGVLTKYSFLFKEVFYSDGEKINHEVTKEYSFKDIEALEVEE